MIPPCLNVSFDLTLIVMRDIRYCMIQLNPAMSRLGKIKEKVIFNKHIQFLKQ